MKFQSRVIVVVGPTAVGKTSMSIDIAQHYGAEIISADSRQIYREMELGTAKPTLEERSRVFHHLVDSHSIEENYDVGTFKIDAERLTDGLHQKGTPVVMVGGSGLYVKAFCDGLDEMPKVGDGVRQSLNEEYDQYGLQKLLQELKEKDITYFTQVDQNNPQRIIRALEIIRTTNQPYSIFRTNKTPLKSRNYDILKIGLELDRSDLYDRINQRMDDMISNGLFEEAERLFPKRALNALQTVGYQEIFGYLEGLYDRDEAIRLLKRNSRRYAKRQMTWFKKDWEITWFHPSELENIVKFIDDQMGRDDTI
jgi:tRNA dimethylallyltransferase